MMDRNEIEVKFITTSLPRPLHEELRQIAAEEGLTLSKFFRETLVSKLERRRATARRRRA